MTNGNEPAYPAMDFNHRGDGTGQLELRYNGMTKREFFAAMAMQGYMAHQYTPHQNPEEIAEYALKCADALITALTATTDLTEKMKGE